MRISNENGKWKFSSFINRTNKIIKTCKNIAICFVLIKHLYIIFILLHSKYLINLLCMKHLKWQLMNNYVIFMRVVTINETNVIFLQVFVICLLTKSYLFRIVCLCDWIRDWINYLYESFKVMNNYVILLHDNEGNVIWFLVLVCVTRGQCFPLFLNLLSGE